MTLLEKCSEEMDCIQDLFCVVCWERSFATIAPSCPPVVPVGSLLGHSNPISFLEGQVRGLLACKVVQGHDNLWFGSNWWRNSRALCHRVGNVLVGMHLGSMEWAVIIS